MMNSKQSSDYKRFKTSSDRHQHYSSDRSKQYSNQFRSSLQPKYSFNYERYKYILNKMFFSVCEKVKLGSKEHEEFWIFLRRYQTIEENARIKGQSHYTDLVNKRLTQIKHMVIPDEWTDLESMISNACIINDFDDYSNILTRERIEKFRDIAVFYLDFRDKQRAKALEKLKQIQMDLPIYQYKDDILSALSNHSVVLIAGDTGCGKSTQVPQYLLHSGYDNIACTQPRRIACISLRKRVAYETFNEFGAEIGYQIRFERKKSKHTKILFLTEGLLLRQVTSDPLLSNYNVIILDEVHERHLSCDFLLGVVKCLIHQRNQDLKIILMSATINTALFSSYFGNCPVIEVPGRLYPIELRYQPIPKTELIVSTKSRINPKPYLNILQQIDDKYPSTERGDLLIFLSGLQEITTVAEVLAPYAQQTEKWIVLYLHSSLSIDEQDKVFDIAPEGVRKCVLSTNIAETSVTIDCIRFVVDSGKVKEMSYDPNCKMQTLQEFWISKASAEQRKGRAGRTGAGVCFRLYSCEQFEQFSLYSTPEIHRVPLHSLLLQMIAMGLPDVRKFPFLDPPNDQSIKQALESLVSHSALTNQQLLTSMGKMLSRLPVDITVGKILILGSVFNLSEAFISLSAILSIQSPITNKARGTDSVCSLQSLQSSHGDPFTLLNIYNKWLEIKSSNQDSRKWCKNRGLEEQRFYEITKLRLQFKELLKEARLLDDSGSTDLNEMNSTERIRRYGEMLRLKKLKRESDKNSCKKRKLLKMSRFDEQSESENENEIDIKDVEFRLSHDRKQVEALRAASDAYTHKDITLMKLILCSGLYPQIAISDEHNSYKKDSDQIFHSKDKPFVIIHPTSIFATEPELLKLSESDKSFIKELRSLSPFSRKHQLIAYVSLLETTKPYLCNCVRLPAAHALLLLSHQIDTNYDFTRIVCDGWLEMEFVSSVDSQNFLSLALEVRDLWQKLLRKIFDECFENVDNDDNLLRSGEVRQMQTQLTKSIDSFLRLEILHTLRRLLAIDIKHLYAEKRYQDERVHHIQLDKLFRKPTKHDYKVDANKGGLQINGYLTYNCLNSKDNSKLQYIKKDWICPKCKKEMSATVLEQYRHISQCSAYTDANDSSMQTDIEESTSQQTTSKSYDPLKLLYKCSECEKSLLLTSVEILKHKRNHKCTETDKSNTQTLDL